MAMIPEVAYAMLACTRIGAVHSVGVRRFLADSLAGRRGIAGRTSSSPPTRGCAGGRHNSVKENTTGPSTSPPRRHAGQDGAGGAPHGGKINWAEGRDFWLHRGNRIGEGGVQAREHEGGGPLFHPYTSGSTGEPKGVLHTTGGYLVHVAATHKYVFDYHDGDIYWCTADVGWVTGHSYILYGPLANGATTLMFEGVPNYPDISRFWNVVDKHQVNIFYTAPTAIRALMGRRRLVKKGSRKSCASSLGRRAINPEAWEGTSTWWATSAARW